MATTNEELSGKLVAQGAQQKPLSLKEKAGQWFEKNRSAMSALMGSEEDAKRMYLACLNSVSKSPQLLQADPSSIFKALMQCAELKLYPGPLQEAALVPFFNSKKRCYECNFMPMYQGLVKLATNSGYLKSIYANVIHEADYFDYSYGSGGSLKHQPAKQNRGNLIGAYAFAKTRYDEQIFEVMWAEDIMKIKARSSAKDKDYSPWNQKDFEPWMWRKTVLKQLLKLVPKTIDLATAMEEDSIVEVGETRSPLADLVGGIEMSIETKEGE